MILKIDAPTVALLGEVERKISAAVKVPVKRKSALARIILQWALSRISDATIAELAPRLLTPAQRRKALIDEITSFPGQLEQKQIAVLMRAVAKLKQKDQASKNATPKNMT